MDRETLMTAEDAHSAVAEYLRQHETKSLLRFITCGSVDDGKSTLIGRLLHDTKLLLDDQLAALEADSRRHGTQNGEIDFALLVDGLAAEREQGITIDVAYRFFGTDRRKFIVADCPGHEQYTRNMATGASNADLAIVLVDARKGLLTQTRRHSYIVSLLGIRHVLLAVNKMDLVGYDESVFEQIESEYRELARQLGIANVTCIPLSALKGDNMLRHSARDAVVPRTVVAGTPGDGAGRARRQRGRIPVAGAMGLPAEPEFPRVRRHHRRGRTETGR